MDLERTLQDVRGGDGSSDRAVWYRLDEICGVRTLECLPDGKLIQSERDAIEVIGEAVHHGAQMVVIPATQLAPEFFRLRTGVAGAVLQKFVQYGRRLVILGDVAPYVAESQAFAAFMSEANRGRDVWFLPDRPALDKRLAALVGQD